MFVECEYKRENNKNTGIRICVYRVGRNESPRFAFHIMVTKDLLKKANIPEDSKLSLLYGIEEDSGKVLIRRATDGRKFTSMRSKTQLKVLTTHLPSWLKRDVVKPQNADFSFGDGEILFEVPKEFRVDI